MSSSRRPEHTAPPEIYYNDVEAKKYSSKLIVFLVQFFESSRMYLSFFAFSSHIIEIQQKLSERALELLALPDDKPCYILDIG